MLYFPKKTNKIFTRAKSKIMITICWVMGFLAVIPSLTKLWGWHGMDCKTKGCTILDREENFPYKKFLFAVGVAFPSVVLIVTNVMIYVKVSFLNYFPLSCNG